MEGIKNLPRIGISNVPPYYSYLNVQSKLLKVLIHIRLIFSLSTSSNLYDRSGVLSILELTSLDDTNSRVCPLRHLATYLGASEGRRKPHSGYSVFINNEGQPPEVKHIKNEGQPLVIKYFNNSELSTLLKSGIDINRFKSHSTHSAIGSLLLSNNVPFHIVKKMVRWKSNYTVDTFYDKRIIGEKSGGFLNTVVQIS
ncbi:hypothetical protein ACTFIY_008894 [Dictyostelium cf. discoideum]